MLDNVLASSFWKNHQQIEEYKKVASLESEDLETICHMLANRRNLEFLCLIEAYWVIIRSLFC